MTVAVFGSLVKKLVAGAEADAIKVKNAVIAAMKEVDGVVLPEAEKYEGLIEDLAAVVLPSSGAKIVDVAYAWLESTAKVINDGGAAAEANLINAGLDAALVAAIKAYIPALKAAAAATPAPATV